MQIETSTATTDQAAAPAETQTTSQPAPASAAPENGQQTGTETTDTTAAAPAETEQQEQQRAQHRNKVQERINELTFKKNEAERQARHWQAIAEGRQTPAAPKATDFGSDEEYQTALWDHRVKTGVQQGLSENAQQAAQKFSQDAAAAQAETYSQRVSEAVQRMPDFAEVVGKADINISPALQGALMDSEMGPDLVYHLAKNPADAQRLSQLPERQMLRELITMESTLGKPSAPAARTTKAPPPVKPGSAAAAPANTDPAKMNQREYEAWRKSSGSKYIR